MCSFWTRDSARNHRRYARNNPCCWLELRMPASGNAHLRVLFHAKKFCRHDRPAKTNRIKTSDLAAGPATRPRSGAWAKLRDAAQSHDGRARQFCRPYECVNELPHPLIPADAGIPTLPNCRDIQWAEAGSPRPRGRAGGEAGVLICFFHRPYTAARRSLRRALRSKNSAWLMTAETAEGWNGLAIKKAGSGRSPVRNRSG